MKYEIYKTLTQEQKEEWQFRFKDMSNPSYIPVLTIVFMIFSFMAVSILLMTTYVVKEKYDNEHFTALVYQVVDVGLRLFLVTTIILIFELFGYYVKIFYYQWRERKWLKQIKQ